MSPLSRFMRAASAILDAKDGNRIAPSPERPPIFIRTNWLFTEIVEGIEKSERIVKQIRIARLENNVIGAARLTADLATVTGQISELSKFARKHFAQEIGNAD